MRNWKEIGVERLTKEDKVNKQMREQFQVLCCAEADCAESGLLHTPKPEESL